MDLGPLIQKISKTPASTDISAVPMSVLAVRNTSGRWLGLRYSRDLGHVSGVLAGPPLGNVNPKVAPWPTCPSANT